MLSDPSKPLSGIALVEYTSEAGTSSSGCLKTNASGVVSPAGSTVMEKS
jgi:hypothetical protein